MTDAHIEESAPVKDRSKNAPTRSRDQVSAEIEEQPNFFRRIWLFITQVIAELKKVTYPTAAETWTYFTVVIFFVMVIMAYAGLLDYLFAKLNAVVFG